MKIRNDFMLCYLVISFLFGACIFLYGFFPLSYTSDQSAEWRELPEFIDDVPLNRSAYKPHVSRIILMVIDAFRTDFIQYHQNLSMKYTNKLIIESKACAYNLHVEAPTVTMPRIKAMTSGTIPNFIDVVLNLGNRELKIDSFLHQVYNKGSKIVFCGDDTWVKMFPEMFARKLENKDSLFVNDFYEGDKNITQKLSAELKRTDWELLILHFLGLDHIGHVEGPMSPKVPMKLKEMDTVIMHIHLAMQEYDKRFELPSLLIVTADHGMRDTGGHGGSSYHEINVPFIALGLDCTPSGDTFKQIDIAPTLSVLFGLPIPASSIGTILPNLITGLPMEQQLYALHYNGKRLLNKIIDVEGLDEISDTEIYKQFHQAEEEHKQFIKNTDVTANVENIIAFKRAKLLYETSASEMSLVLAKLYVTYDNFSTSLGLTCLTLTLISIILINVQSEKSSKIFIKSTIFAIIMGGISRQPICKLNNLDSGLCLKTKFHIQNAVFAAICGVMAIELGLIFQWLGKLNYSTVVKKIISIPKFCYLLLLGLILHLISYASSSFIEEEHQTWYYLTSTILVALCYLEVKMNLKAEKSKEKPKTESRTNHVDNISCKPNYSKWFLLFLGHLIARRLNQTGDKWLMEPDIGDWLVLDEYRLWNSFFVFSSLGHMILNLVDFGSILTNVLTLTASILIYYYRTLVGSVFFAGIKMSDSTNTCLLLFWLNIFEIAAINFVPVLFKLAYRNVRKIDIKICLGTTIVLFALVSALTHKPHNIFLTSLLLYTSFLANQTTKRLFKKTSPASEIFIHCIIHYWLGKEFFFYQGNSNSLASIDLNAGYIGLKKFNIFAVGILLTINTFSGPILSMLLLIYNLYDCEEAPITRSTDFAKQRLHANQMCQKKDNLINMLYILSILFAIPFTFYSFCVIAFRHHIFIWTVFSPKLMYEFYQLCIMIALWLGMFLIRD